MLESALAIENAAEIASVPGIDALFIGANDLAIDLGIPDQFDSPRFREVMDRIVDGGRSHGKTIGIGGIRDGELMRHLFERGVAIVLGDMEATLLVAGDVARRATCAPCRRKPVLPIRRRVRRKHDDSNLDYRNSL